MVIRRRADIGTVIVRGISTALFVAVLTLLAGILWKAMGFQAISISALVDIGLAISCLAGGYRAGKESRLWFLGGAVGGGFVLVGVILLALFAPVRTLGVFEVLAEGVILGAIAGAFGSGGTPTGSGGFLQGFRSSPRYPYSHSVPADTLAAGHDKDRWNEPVLSADTIGPDRAEFRPAGSWQEEEWPVSSPARLGADPNPAKSGKWDPGGDELDSSAWSKNGGTVGRPWWELD